MKKDFVIDPMTKGYIQIYTGNGKGKTTAAMGLAMRAAGAGMKVYIGEFIKEVEYGEIRMLRERFPEIDVEFFKEDEGDLVSVSKTEGNHTAVKNDSHGVRGVMRSAGAGVKGYFGQLIKDMEHSELKRLRDLFPEIDVELYRDDHGELISVARSDRNHEAAKQGFERVREVVLSGEYDVVILDELTILPLIRVIKEKDVLKLMEDKPENVELIITGRHASKRMIKNADLVSEVQEVKHYFREGVLSRKGIEC